MNLQAYAAHRKAHGLRGQSHVAVLKAIQSGRLTSPAVRRDGGHWVIDPELADQQWAATTGSAPAGGVPPGSPPTHEGRQKTGAAIEAFEAQASMKGVPSVAVSKAVRAAFDAKLAQLEYQQKSGELVRRDEITREAFALARAVRDSMMRVPDRLAPILAATTDARKVHQVLSDEIRVALRSLADG